MTKRLLLVFAIVGLAVASAKTYSITLSQPAVLGDMQLAPGNYSVDVVDQKAIIRNGKMHGEAPVKVETADMKYNSTSLRFSSADGKMHLQEIHVGGSTTKLVFTE
ncbi:MAG TPA: hypothetical protein VG096_24470 [Bryobacteraceae bacterium]|nr:hypothetical protein [Bryobacteraceae bacterium]